MKVLRTLVTLVAALAFAGVPSYAQYAPSAGSSLSRVAGRFVSSNYNYPPTNNYVVNGNSSTGTASITVQTARITLPDGRRIFPYNIFSPIVVGGPSNQELVTPTSVSNCYVLTTPGNGTCTITATFANTHGQGDPVISGTGGIAEASYDAFLTGGGVVTIDNPGSVGIPIGCTNCYTSFANAMQSLVPFPQVGFEDVRKAPPVMWNLTPAPTTPFSAPSALTSATVAASTSACTPVSSCFAGGTIHVCYALVDAMGNEGPCSADYSFTDTTALGVLFQAPPAATGAVGYIPYVGLESGSSGNEYQTLLYTQPSTIDLAPAGNGVCTLTTIETITPACAITNATYGQTGSTANVTAYPVVTSPQAVGLGGLSTASYYIGNSNSRTVYQYQPGATWGTRGIVRSAGQFHITTAAASTVPQVLGTLAIPSGFMNYAGRSIRVCGMAYSSTQGASTVVSIKFEWDAQGSDVTTGLPVILGGPLVTNTLTTGTIASFSFCQDLTTTVASASATGGTILAGNGYLIESALNTGATPAAGPSIIQAGAGVGSLNLAGPARLQIVMVQTTSSTAVPALQNLTVQVLN